jgi:hypothetical protein
MTEFVERFELNQNKADIESLLEMYSAAIPYFDKDRLMYEDYDDDEYEDNADDVAIEINDDMETTPPKNEKYIPKPKKYFDFVNKGFGENQDFCKIGKGVDKFETIEIGSALKEFEYIVLCDGHGNSICYNYYFKPILDEMDFSDLLGNENPVDAIICHIESRSLKCIQQFQVGATLSIAKIYKTENNIKVVCYNMGNSRTKVFWNNELIYANRPHVIMEKSESARLHKQLACRNAVVCPSSKYVMFDENTLMEIENPRTSFYSHHKFWSIQLVSSQCIGHHGITGAEPEIFEMNFAIQKGAPCKLSVCVLSNGVDDMTMESSVEDNNMLSNMSCGEIVDIIEKRWRKKWKLLLPNKMGIYKNDDGSQYNMDFGSSLDDCSIGVWSYSE